ncbi:MAG: PrsW family glutamic-type intramembrane protease [Candidatus Paceibacterota bacterium]|jgi:RsiW-degrading membrane proteinase PrsW (M82 family)
MDNSFNNIFLYFLLAILPGFTWLLFFLKKDKLPEPKFKILQIFYFGIFSAFPAALLELWLMKGFDTTPIITSLSIIPHLLIKYILIIGLAEELFKYLVVRYFVLKNSCMDEPVDIPLYMIVSALGFATAENLLVFAGHSFNIITEPFILSLVRFLGATLLHALCSGVIGVFIALSFYWLKQRVLLLFTGFTLGIVIHGLFDFNLDSSIIGLTQNNYAIFYPILLLILSYALLAFSLIKIKKLKSVCIIQQTSK